MQQRSTLLPRPALATGLREREREGLPVGSLWRGHPGLFARPHLQPGLRSRPAEGEVGCGTSRTALA